MTTTVSKDELKEKIRDITLIDVRDQHSYKLGHIQGAEDIPLENLENEFRKKYSPEEKNIVIYGEDEKMGAEAIEKLEMAGYKNVELYKAGIKEWRDSRFPLKRESLGMDMREEHF